MINQDIIDVDYEPVFEDPAPIDEKKLLENTANDELDFDKLGFEVGNKKNATKPKILTKKQRKTRIKMTKQSRRRNRH